MSQLMDAALEGATLMNIYLVQEKLGKGGMAWVYKGIHQRLQSPIAIKILASIVASEPDARMRFLREARLQFGLQHTNIVRVIDMVEEGDLCGIVMEWCDGGDLHEWFHKRRRPIGAQHVRAYFLPLLDALAMAHARGIVHRDLKPRNVLLSSTPTGFVTKLTDFGIAKALDEESHTVTGATIGTLRYIAPEQLTDSKHVDHRADIYSFGVMLYFLLTGRPPFLGPGHAIVQQILNEPPPEPVEAPLPLRPILLRCLAKHPDDRFADCLALQYALQEALVGIPDSDESPADHPDLILSHPDSLVFGPGAEHLTVPHEPGAVGQTVSQGPRALHTAAAASPAFHEQERSLPSSDSLSGADSKAPARGFGEFRAQASPPTVPMKSPSLADFAAIQRAERVDDSTGYPLSSDGLRRDDMREGPRTTPMHIPPFAAAQGGAVSNSTEGASNLWKWLALLLLLILAGASLAWVWIAWFGHPAETSSTPAANQGAAVVQRSVQPGQTPARQVVPAARSEVDKPDTRGPNGLVPDRRKSLPQPTAAKGTPRISPPSTGRPQGQLPSTRRRPPRRRNSRKASRLRAKGSRRLVADRRKARRKVKRSRRKNKQPRRRLRRGAPYQFRPLKAITRYMTIEAKAADVLLGTGRLPKDAVGNRERIRVRQHLCKIGFGRACGSMALVRPFKDLIRSIALLKRGCKLGSSWSCVHWGLMYTGYWDGTDHLRDPKKACPILEEACQRKSRWGCGQYNHHRCGGDTLAPFPRIRQDTTHKTSPAFQKKRSFRLTARLVYMIAKSKMGYTTYQQMVPWLEQACELGVGGACWLSGRARQKAKKDRSAYLLFQRGCRLMDRNSCGSIGVMESGEFQEYDSFTNVTRACIHLDLSCRLKANWACYKLSKLRCSKP